MDLGTLSSVVVNLYVLPRRRTLVPAELIRGRTGPVPAWLCERCRERAALGGGVDDAGGECQVMLTGTGGAAAGCVAALPLCARSGTGACTPDGLLLGQMDGVALDDAGENALGSEPEPPEL